MTEIIKARERAIILTRPIGQSARFRAAHIGTKTAAKHNARAHTGLLHIGQFLRPQRGLGAVGKMHRRIHRLSVWEMAQMALKD